MLQVKHRKIAVAGFSAGIVLILASLIAAWNAFVSGKEKLGVFPALFALLAIALLVYLFFVFYKLTDFKLFEAHVIQKSEEARADLLNQIRLEQEKLKQQEFVLDDTQEQAKTLIPQGNFKNVDSYAKKLLITLANYFNLVQGIVYTSADGGESFNFCAAYGLTTEKSPVGFKKGENLNGQVAAEQQMQIIEEIPENYFMVESGLGKSKPNLLILMPLVVEKKTIAVVEMASFAAMGPKQLAILQEASSLLAVKMNQFVKA